MINMVRAYYATHNTNSVKEFQVVVLDDTREEDQRLINSGYVKELKYPDGGPEGADRAR